MINNRMLAVAAVLVMAVPALGAATPIVVPPVPEQLVEGHTVFTVIEIIAATQTNETRFAAAVAVLVREYQAEERAQRFPGVLWFNDQYLVNPYQNARDNAAFRYPCGGAVLAVNRGDPDPRMVIARVNTGTPQVIAGGSEVVPATGGPSVTYGDDSYTYTYPPWVKPYPGTYYYGQNNTGPDGVSGTADDNQNTPTDYAWVGVNASQGSINADDQTVSGQMVYSDTVVGSTLGGLDGNLFNVTPPWDYRESYLITDPNDHSWIIDKYEFYTRDSNVHSQNEYNLNEKLGDAPAMIDTNGDGIGDYQPSEHYPEAFGGELQNTPIPDGGSYGYPVWVVNMLGSPLFVPDNGVAINIGGEFIGENCAPFKDLIESVTEPANGALCGVAVDDPLFNPLGTGNDSDITLNAYNGVPPWTDDPCMGYTEPTSRNGFCYGGQTPDADGCSYIPPSQCDNYRGNPCEPLRQYNALLYFKLEDLRVFGAPRDHCNFDATANGGAGGCNPALSGDTNGCSEEQYPWGPNPPRAANDWPCPNDPNLDGDCRDGTGSVAPGNDDCEGDSHPFHPTTPPHDVAETCLPEFYYNADPNAAGPQRANPTNHGGSSYITPDMRANDDGWYEFAAPCDYLHATRNIDIYFAGGGRPFPPLARNFVVVDLEGSSAPFHDYHCAYETAPTYPCPPAESAAPIVGLPPVPAP